MYVVGVILPVSLEGSSSLLSPRETIVWPSCLNKLSTCFQSTIFRQGGWQCVQLFGFLLVWSCFCDYLAMGSHERDRSFSSIQYYGINHGITANVGDWNNCSTIDLVIPNWEIPSIPTEKSVSPWKFQCKVSL